MQPRRLRLPVPLLAVLVALLPPGPALAQSQGEMTATAAGEARDANLRLKEALAQLNAKISPAGRARLKSADTAWQRYRETQCEFNAAGSAGGSVHAMIVSLCHADLTKQQAELLEAQLNCGEGDLSCGHQ